MAMCGSPCGYRVIEDGGDCCMMVNDMATVQEATFSFDREFADYRVDNPILRKHKEWDDEAMMGTSDFEPLTPERYNRCPHQRYNSFKCIAYFVHFEIHCETTSSGQMGYVQTSFRIPSYCFAFIIQEKLVPAQGDRNFKEAESVAAVLTV
jgi:hypothetical protein